jgi:cell wall-associated NlpC family hydrolase
LVNGRRFRSDCTGTILAAYYAAGIDLEAEFNRYTGNGVARLYKIAADHGLIREGTVPQPGDVIFWDNTYDRDGDDRWNDPLTHAGIVVRSYGNGRLEYVHYDYRDGIVVARMNLASPEVHRAEGRVVNSPMRMRSHRHLNPSKWLSSHLYRSRGMLYRLQ